MKTTPIIVGLTGSIAMGKSTTADMFRARGIPIWDADASVAALYAKDGAAVGPIFEAFPDVVTDEAVDREALKKIISNDPNVLKKIEAIVHPLVAADRQIFLNAHEREQIVVLDIPLLFETGLNTSVDKTVVVTVSPETQRQRLLARRTMSDETINLILAKQMPDAEKQERADYIVETYDMKIAEAAVDEIIRELTQPHA